jgi:serine protease Do
MAQVYGMPQGIYITGVNEKSAADAAGIQVHDIIVKFDTFDVESTADLSEALQYYAAGTTVTIEVMRIQGNEYVKVPLELTLGTKPAN